MKPADIHPPYPIYYLPDSIIEPMNHYLNTTAEGLYSLWLLAGRWHNTLG